MIKLCTWIIFFVTLSYITKCETSFKYSFSFNYYKDLSDSYRGGNLLSGGLSITKLWYGTEISYGYFLSQSTYSIKISVEEINRSIEIPIDEMAIMNLTSLSFILRPINSERISTDFLLGMVLGYAKNLILESVYYNYNFTENSFSYLYRDYQLIKHNHIHIFRKWEGIMFYFN